MDSDVFPPFVESLKGAEQLAEGLTGRVMEAASGFVVFMQAEIDVTVPMHRHGEQWGVVLDGSMTLTMNDRTTTYKRGDFHYIPAGVDHEATLLAGWKGMYVFPRNAPAEMSSWR